MNIDKAEKNEASNKVSIIDFRIADNKENLKSKVKAAEPNAKNIRLRVSNKKLLIINNHYLSLLLAIFMLIILFSGRVSALGITPGRTIINFEPGLKKTVFFDVINSEAKDMKVVIYTRGDLREIVTLGEDSAEFSASEKSKTFSYEINLPDKIEGYGRHEIEIVVAEVPEESEKEGTVVGATVAVTTQFWVYVPYPGKYLDAELNILESEKNATTKFFIPVINRGKERIGKIDAKIEIYDNKGSKIGTIKTNEKSIEPEKSEELYAEWQANVETGKYKAVAIISYDGEKKQIEKEFSVGEAFLMIELVTVKDFQLGGIAKFTILVYSNWNEDLKDVYVQMLFYDKENEVMADFRSVTYEVKAKSRTEMLAYWDSAGTKPGIYDGKIILKYGEKSNEKNIKVKITENSIEIIGLTGLAIVPKEGKLNTRTLIAILITLVIISNIIWFVVIKKLKKKKQEKGKRDKGGKEKGVVVKK